MNTLTSDTGRLAPCELSFLTAFARDLAAGEDAGDGLLRLVIEVSAFGARPRLAGFLRRQRREERRHGRLAARLLQACNGEAGSSALITVLGAARAFTSGPAAIVAIHLVLENLIAAELSALMAAYADCPTVAGLVARIHRDEAKHARFGCSWSRQHPQSLSAWDGDLCAWVGELLTQLDQQQGWDDLPERRQQRYQQGRAAAWGASRAAVLPALAVNGLARTVNALAGWCR